MKTFNALQIVCAFMAWPYGIAWLSEATFKGNTPAFYMACAVYIISTAFMVGSVRDSMRSDGPWFW